MQGSLAMWRGFTLIWKDPGTVKSPLPWARVAWQAGISLFENTTWILVSATDPQAKKKKKLFPSAFIYPPQAGENPTAHTPHSYWQAQNMTRIKQRTHYAASACAHKHHAIKALCVCVCSTPILAKVIKAVNYPLRLCQVKFQSW